MLSEFLKNNGVPSPKVLLMMRRHRTGTGISQDLAFNITPENFETEATYRSVMQQLAWFLPRHYSFLGLAEETLENSFLPL